MAGVIIGRLKNALKALFEPRASGRHIDILVDEPVGEYAREEWGLYSRALYDEAEAYPARSDFSSTEEFLKFSFMPPLSGEEIAAMDTDVLIDGLCSRRTDKY